MVNNLVRYIMSKSTKATKRDPKADVKAVSTIPTVSGKIRSLNAMGYTRSQIADMLGKRYQHVYNVLTEDARKTSTAS